MAKSMTANDWMAKTFTTAVLLSGSAELAGLAMVEALQTMDTERDNGDDLLLHTFRSLLRLPANALSAGGENLIPEELRPVLRMRPLLRHVYVLRVLEGLSRRICADLLHIDIDGLNWATGEAMKDLARIVNGNRRVSGEMAFCCQPINVMAENSNMAQ